MEMKKYKLGDILELQRGYDLTSAKMKNANIPVAGSNGVIGYHDVAKCITPCITVGRSGSVGKVHFYRDPVWVHNTALYVSNFKGNDPKYLYYLLSVLKLDVLCGSSVVPSLNRNVVYPMEVPFCSDVGLQNKISSILSTLDQRIENLRVQNRVLEQTAKTIYDYTFLQCAGHQTTYNKTLNRNIPADWEVKKLAEIANITMGQSPEGSSYNENGEGKIFYQGCTDFGVMFPTPRLYTTAPTRFAKVNDILMSVRAPVGTLNIANAECCIGRGLAALNSKKVSNVFLYYVMKNFENHFKNAYSIGTTFGSITKNDLYDLPVLYPDSKTLDLFSTQVSPLFKKQLVNSQQIEALTTQRNTLLPLLMTGQIQL